MAARMLARRDAHDAAGRHRARRPSPPTRRLTELEFSLPAPRVSAHALNATLRSLGYDVPRLAFRDLEGYLEGLHRPRLRARRPLLRARLEIEPPRLRARPTTAPPRCRRRWPSTATTCSTCSMRWRVDRYLRHRVPGYRHDTHFGGVLYLFVRGVRPDWVNADGTPAGVFHHRPTAATLARLDALFAHGAGAEGGAMTAPLIRRPTRRSPRASPATSCAGPARAAPPATRSTRCGQPRARRASPPPRVTSAPISPTSSRPASDLDEPALRRALLESGMVGTPEAPAAHPLILDDDGRLYLHRYFDYERRLARRLTAACARPGARHRRRRRKALLDRLFAANAKRLGERPDWQKIATALALERRLTIISGGPGTGKTTTVVNVLACVLAGNPDCRIRLAAPTGKAAARMLEAIRSAAAHLPADLRERLPAESFTVHRLLGVLPGSDEFRHHAGNPLPIDLLVVDEASMLDLALATKLVEAVPPAAQHHPAGRQGPARRRRIRRRVLGALRRSDAEQRVRRAALRRHRHPRRAHRRAPRRSSRRASHDSVVWLTENFRFAQDSGIGRLAAHVNAGEAAGRDRLPALAAPIRRSSGSRTRIPPRRPHRSSGSSTGWRAYIDAARADLGRHGGAVRRAGALPRAVRRARGPARRRRDQPVCRPALPQGARPSARSRRPLRVVSGPPGDGARATTTC